MKFLIPVRLHCEIRCAQFIGQYLSLGVSCFRWRGENVSTTEVETIMSEIVSNNCSSSKTVVSYGVEIPGNEGRASMVAIVDSNEASENDETTEPVNMGDLYSSVEKKLPSYARPIFVRLPKSVETTGTQKNYNSKPMWKPIVLNP